MNIVNLPSLGKWTPEAIARFKSLRAKIEAGASASGKQFYLLMPPFFPNYAPPPETPAEKYLCLVGDDLEVSRGPAGFPPAILSESFARADLAVIWSGGTSMAVEKFLPGIVVRAGIDRLVLVETRLQHHCAWRDYAARHGVETSHIMPARGAA